MALTIDPEVFYTAVATMPQLHGAARALESCLEGDGCSEIRYSRPSGDAVDVIVPNETLVQAGQRIRSILARTEAGAVTEIARACAGVVRDDLVVELHPSVHGLAADPGGADEARDVLASLAQLTSLVTGVKSAARMRSAASATAVQYLVYHAASARRIMDRMVAVPDPRERARIMRQVSTALGEYHRLAERCCNGDDAHDRLTSRMDEIEGEMREVLGAAGCPQLRFCSDPRGAPMVIQGGREGDVYFVRLPEEVRMQVGVAPAQRPRQQARGQQDQSVDVREREIAPHVLEVLRASRLEGDKLYLPEQLERKLYEEVAEALRIAGAKWVGGKTRAHVLGKSAQSLLRMLATGRIVDPKEYDFFATPAALAREAVEEADIEPGMLVAEPSAGLGAIAKLLAEKVGAGNVHAYELLPEHQDVLHGMGLQVHPGDFLAHEPRPMFDRPPSFSRGWGRLGRRLWCRPTCSRASLS